MLEDAGYEVESNPGEPEDIEIQSAFAPVIDGLLQHIPHGKIWAVKDQDHWLKMMKDAFAMVYQEPTEPTSDAPTS